ncbi:MAG: hypothetical protein ACREF3_18160 [Acetobacteraceae bacterium]
MRKAIHASTTTRDSQQDRPDFAPAIAKFRQLVAESGDRLLLGDGPPNPDARLLDLCAEALHHLVTAEKALAARRWDATSDQAENDRLLHIYTDGISRSRTPLNLIAKVKATTAAGVYAKATVVRASRTGAAKLAMTLAEDLLANAPLRVLVWGPELTGSGSLA